MTLAEALRAATARLDDGGIEGAARDARALVAAAAGLRPERLLLESGSAIDAGALARLEAMLARRLAREPVSRILGERLFWGRSFAVTPDVLDPRPETECLVAAALEGGAPERLADLGTGSGILAVTLLAEWAQARAVASDISDAALAVAGRNAQRHGVADRLELCRADWFDGLEGEFDLLLSNPPYIAGDEMAGLSEEVRAHDPEGALSPGGDGLDAYRAIARGAARHLRPGGRLLLEIGPTQGAAVSALLRAAGFTGVETRPDLDRRDRVVTARRPGQAASGRENAEKAL